MPTPIVLDSGSTTNLVPPFEPTPVELALEALRAVVAHDDETPELDALGRPVEKVFFRSMAGAAWGSYRLVVDNLDVTYFQGVAVKIGGYQLTEPYGYGPATFEFPQITGLQVDQWGTGALSWFGMGKQVRLIQVDDDLNYVRLVWKGVMTALTPGMDSTVAVCAGDLSGRASLRTKHPQVFLWSKDIGTLLRAALRDVGVTISPAEPVTGIELQSRSQQGTYLSWMDYLLSMWQEADGDQGTLMPNADGSAYLAQLKDRTTIDATAWYGLPGFDLDATRDLSEEPTTVYATWQEPGGQICANIKVPGLVQGAAPTFPGTLSLGDTGDDVVVLGSKLFGMGFLDRTDTSTTFTAAIANAVKDLQKVAGLSVTGVVNAATWDALFDVTVTGPSLVNAHQAPVAQIDAVRKYFETSNGSIAGVNPSYDPARVQVDIDIDYGPGITRKRVFANAQAKLDLIQTGSNWAGTARLTADVAAGNATSAGTVTAMSRLDITPGMNLQVHRFDGTTLFHVATVDVDGRQVVQLGLDTKARDALELGQILERDAQSRINPARQWLRQHRNTDANRGVVHFIEWGGEVFSKVLCPADQWTVFPVLAGQSGSVEQIRIQVSNDPSEFVAVATAKKIGPNYLQHKVGNPFDTNSHGESKWTNSGIQADIDAGRAVLGAWGDAAQPLGYHPRKHTNDAGDTTDAPITGLFLDAGGFDYHTFNQPVIYIGIYPREECYIRPQRMVWPVVEPGAN